MIAQAWQAANDKARETRVDWNTHHPLSRKKTETMTQAFGFGRPPFFVAAVVPALQCTP